MPSAAEKIGPHLPFLRRFGRALTGSQERGDEAVAALLESLIANPRSLPEHDDGRVAAYRVFLQRWNAASAAPPAGAKGTADDVGGRMLQGIDSGPRQAFLLTALEGFQVEDAAYILGTEPTEVLHLLEQAGHQMAEQMATQVVIIEDEPLVAMDLEGIVTSLGHRVVATARTHGQAVEAVARHKPGLVLADIQLADGSSGLHAINEILRSVDLHVIFVTAFPERLLTGGRPEPTFLITKPFKVDAVKAIISQVLFFDVRSKAAERRFG
jgi:CheY-like chemotaxis protein